VLRRTGGQAKRVEEKDLTARWKRGARVPQGVGDRFRKKRTPVVAAKQRHRGENTVKHYPKKKQKNKKKRAARQPRQREQEA